MRSWLAVMMFIGIGFPAEPQSATPATAPEAMTAASFSARASQDEDDTASRGVRLKLIPRNILQDQQALFSVPFRAGERQWKNVVPFSAFMVGLVATDTAFEGHVTSNATTASRFRILSDTGLATAVGMGGGMYLWGRFTSNEHAREAGLLSGEAAIDAYVDTSLITLVAGRDHPFTANGRGKFFDGGASFPSQHAAVSWAIASVIAREYPGPATKFLSYGLAGAVSLARVEGHQHFVSDAVIGSIVGWYIGQQVYRARSNDADIDPRKWGKFERDENSETERAVSQMGSTYVPLESWIYESLERLAAMGYGQTGSAVMRPWTRLDCARFLAEAQENGAEDDPVAAPLISALRDELSQETSLREGGSNQSSQVESLYGRFTGISGTPLRDSFHFAQTLVDDNGRPYGQGVNGIAGVSTRAEAGSLAFYLRGEYQYAASLPAYNLAAQQTIAAFDGLPFGWNLRSGTTSRFRPIEAYAALNISDWQLSFGQQSMWWGPDRSTAMMLSNNAEPMPMLRLSRVGPSTMPGFLAGLGPVHAEFFLAREGGVHYVGLGPTFALHGDASQGLNPPPYVWGASLSFKPTENFELGFGHTTIFAGYGRPLNLKTFVHTLSLTGNGQAVDPGKRTTEFSFSYRVPGLRNWLTLYSEGFAYDNPVEGKFLARFAMNPGVYIPQLPGARKIDIRIEGAYTNLPGLKGEAYFYSNSHYPQGYTNYGQIFGSWIGRQGSGGTASSTYWFSARNKATVNYRRMAAARSFLRGGNLEDFSGSLTWMLGKGVEFTATSQYESWNFPLLASGPRSDVSTSFGIRLFGIGERPRIEGTGNKR